MKTFLPKNVTFLLVVFLASDPIWAQCAIVSQPISQLECEENSVRFKVVATGSGLTYTWQRKRTTDLAFATVTDDTNTEFSQTDNIRIGNVGSAQYPNGTQFQVIVSNGSCNVTSNVVTLTVNEITNISGGTNVNQCFGTNYSYTVNTSYPANVVSYQWRKSVASGVWNIISDGAIYSGTNSATLNITGGTPAESGEYRVYITFKSSGADCNTTSDSRARKITFLPKLTKPVATITQPSCVSIAGTISVTVQSPTDVYSFDNGLNFQASNEKSGLAAGSYNVIIKNTAGCVSPVEIYEIVPVGQPSIWDGATWLNGNPDINRGITFDGSFNSISDIEACSCQVRNGANVVINSEHTLKITHAVAIVDGTLTFENNASLVQVDDLAVNSGDITYKRITPSLIETDYTYWSSPVFGQTLNISPDYAYGTFYSFNYLINNWSLESLTTAMALGKGYIMRGQRADNTLYNITATFKGVPNNGELTIPLGSANTLNLIGNPYPSALDADSFLDANYGVLNGTIYFWTHKTAIQEASNITNGTAGSGFYAYTSDDYASYNKTGGVANGVGTAANSETNKNNKPTGKIASGQAFFVTGVATIANPVVLFNNSMRVGVGSLTGSNSQFFRQNNTAVLTEKHRIWLNLTNRDGAFKQLLIGYVTGATNGYDGAFDGVSFNGNQFVDFYSIAQQNNLSIQGRTLPFHNQDSVALGYKSTINGEFQISIDQTDGILDSQDVFLEDTDLQILHDLKKEPYSFKTEKGIFNNRFILRYVDKNLDRISIDQEIKEDVNSAVLVSIQDNQIKINSPVELIGKVVVYDVLGREMYQKNKIAVKDFIVPKLDFKHQVLVVSVLLSNNKKVNRKIIY